MRLVILLSWFQGKSFRQAAGFDGLSLSDLAFYLFIFCKKLFQINKTYEWNLFLKVYATITRFSVKELNQRFHSVAIL